MTLPLIQSILSSLGTLMVGYAAVQIHYRIMHSHSIDDNVVKEMKREQKVAFVGMGLIVLSLLLDIYLISIVA